MIRLRGSVFLAFIIGVCGLVGRAEAVETNRYYSYLYFSEGYPTRLRKNRRPESMANRAARENPDVVVQTGFYSLKLDCDTMQLSGFDALEGSDYLSALNQSVTDFSPARLRIRIEKNGVLYTCTGAVPQDASGQNVRLIESGQFVQRFDLTQLIFTDTLGNELGEHPRLEITAWADRVTFLLDAGMVEGVEKTAISIVSPGGKTYRAGGRGGTAVLRVMPHLDRMFEPLDVSAYVGRAKAVKDGGDLEVVYDPEESAVRFELPVDRLRFPEDRGRLDEYEFELTNPLSADTVVPLIFREVRTQGITGTSMLLCGADGAPTGIPVQVSKNWHNDPGHRVKHDGPWLRGYTMVPLQAGETRRFRLRLVTGFWGGVPAVSHAQLSVIGYGGNWKWDESALGCWGESMCYDPAQHLGSAFIADVRPAFTAGKKDGGKYSWTENVGGGDFLVYFDADNTYRWAKQLKTAYYWTGPNMTEVHYSGVTDDEAIAFHYRIRSVCTADYHRRFHAYTYRFLKDVVSPQRLIFHQMAGDYYNSVHFDTYYVGSGSGLTQTLARPEGLSGYAGEAVPFSGAWVTADDHWCSDRDSQEPRARRGLLFMNSTLNGEPFPVCLHPFGAARRGGGRMSFDLAAESVRRSYKAGDVVEGELEFILPAKEPGVYWGDDQEFKARLGRPGSEAWTMTADEYIHNLQLSVEPKAGTLLNSYPVEIAAAQNSAVLADFVIPRGGIGHVPIIVRNVPPGIGLRAERQVDGKWVPLESADFGGRSFYQAVRNASGTLDCAFSIRRPSADLAAAWRVRIVKAE